jgi:hypothetical protein
VKRVAFCSWALPIGMLAAALAGCGRSPATPELKKENSRNLPSFKESKGLFLPEETKQSIGVEVADVTEQKLRHRVSAEVQVFEAKPGGVCRASGIVGRESARSLRPGQTVSLVGEDGKRIEGKIARIDERGVSVPEQAELIVEAPASSNGGTFGSFFTFLAITTNAEAVTVVPTPALLRSAQGDFVYVVNGERLLRTAVKVGDAGDEFFEIKDGLYTGDKVVVRPVEILWLTELRLSRMGGDSD